jgi:hypothetical protein
VLKVLKSVELRYPLAPVLLWVMARVLPLKVKGAETVAEVTWPVPFPVKMPPRVVLPVPPPAAVRVPEREGVKVWVLPLPVMVRAMVWPLAVEVVVAKVTVGPEEVWPAGPMACTAEVMSPSEEVAVRVYPPVEFPTRMFPYDGAVESPVPPYATEMVELAETTPLIAWSGPLREPMVTPPLKTLEAEYVLTVVVPNAVEKTPVEELYESGYTALRDVEEILLLKTLQSDEVRRPRAEAEADGRLKVRMSPEAVMVKSVPEVEEASVWVEPVWYWPAGPMAVMPPPAPASAPQENWPVVAFQRSLSEEPEQEERPAPYI